jgi:predicted  nucleic acid-binding Zn-ribbon protein
MGFHDYAASETSALLTRALGARTDAPLRELQSMRDALESIVRALETAPPIDGEITEVVGRLAEAADAAERRGREEVNAVLREVRGELDIVRAEVERLRVERDAQRSDLERERGELEKRSAALAEMEASLGEMEASLDRLRAELQTERERADSAERDLAVTVDAHSEVESALRKAEAACKHEAQALQDARGLLDLALAETAQVRGELEASRHELEASRQEIEASGQKIEASRQEIAALKEELAAGLEIREQLEARHHSALSADAQVKAAVEEELQEVRGLLDLALAETTELRGQLETRTAEHATLAESLSAARDAHERAEAAQREAAEAAQREATEAARAAEAERDRLARDLEASASRAQALEGERASHEDQIRQLENRIAAATAAETALRERLAGDEREHGDTRAELGALRGDVDRMVSLLDVAVRAIGDLGNSTSVAELLGALVGRLSTEFSRVALFRLKGNRLEGEHQAGFDDTTDVVKLVMPLTLDSMLTRVAMTGTMERLTGNDVAVRAGTPFSGAPESALAMPLTLQGDTFAVIYADRGAAGPGADEAGVAFAKLLAAQTGVLLMRHTDELKTLRELRDYAALLLQEAEHMFIADRESGRPSADVRKRLRDNLDCASQLYAHRAALEGTAAAALLDEQISAVIETGTPFAQDLAAIVGHMADLETQITAEAS